jgi:hypothetical protein
MKRHHASAAVSADAKRGEAVPARQYGGLLVHKAVAKKASASAKKPRQPGPSPYGFVPAGAPIKISRWPKL